MIADLFWFFGFLPIERSSAFVKRDFLHDSGLSVYIFNKNGMFPLKNTKKRR
ncbi:hypothetical protein AB434_1717 [Heyndrickxia coagulans]|uniref:Uncharacterized protein n=1 Tax=Heyndrickxia coagulans TaxID=1398 RepID=A0AAN0WDM5_HEYCO|nr:hypothetical protein SB48_HM08orf05764 [Heyndrickxia coagulans]AKN54122.1 hypothetical protein AB434_1717 [Heyndrickxia coagulans]